MIPTDYRVTVLTDSGPIPSLYVRLLDPLRLVTTNYNIAHSAPQLAPIIAAASDLIILQRWFGPEVLAAAERAKARGCKIVYETDDHLLDLPDQSRMRFSAEQLQFIRRGIAMADLVTCSTEPLAAVLRPINPNVVVLRNYGLPKSAVNQAGAPHAGIVNTDYFKLLDKAPLFEALSSAIADLDYRVTFFGDIDDAALTLARRCPDRVELVAGFTDDRSVFLDQVAASGVNVGIVPLTRSADHGFKSDIKFLDFASLGIPAIFNNPDVYGEVRNGIDGLICDETFDQFRAALARFADARFRADAGAAAHDVVRDQRSIDGYADELAAVIERLATGEPGRSIAGVVERAAEEGGKATGLLADTQGVSLIIGGKQHHVRSIELVRPIIDAGVTFVDEELLPDGPLLAGSPIITTAHVEHLLFGRPQPRSRSARPLRIAWIVPGLVLGSGGHRNVIRCAYQLELRGHAVSLHFTDTLDSSAVIAEQVRDHFYPLEGTIGRFDEGDLYGDVVLATHWSTMRYAESVKSRFDELIYFVQDFEPSFYPMGSEYVMAEDTYRKGYYAITSGVWCEQFLRSQFNAKADHFKFPVDTAIYFERKLDRRQRVIFFAKPEMQRRCFDVGVQALTLFHQMRPDVEIVFYGSASVYNVAVPFPVTQLGILPTTDDLAMLYATAAIGMVFSTTNPSLVPYEMMACGLPVVDLDRAGNDANYDGRRDIACLAGPDPQSLADAIVRLLDDDGERASRSAAGVAFAASFPSEEQVGDIIDDLIVRQLTARGAEAGHR